jgi:acyl-coenzyme A thioesterase PaaI-like protein
MSIDTTSQAVTAGQAKAFMADAGLVIDELTGSRVTAHIELGPEHHTPWGIVNGGVYCTVIQGTASIGASAPSKTGTSSPSGSPTPPTSSGPSPPGP